jgi:hypothetical protein
MTKALRVVKWRDTADSEYGHNTSNRLPERKSLRFHIDSIPKSKAAASVGALVSLDPWQSTCLWTSKNLFLVFVVLILLLLLRELVEEHIIS